ncbi:MAG: CII-binding regulator of phage lambda lysogenization HflD [Candidatus Azotimanducaceae bacterium]|jgi:CII-binding regulator of phage lambda lysogenization HflD
MTARIEKAQSVVMMLDARIAKLQQHMGKLAMDILEAHGAYIQVNRKLYSNTRVTVNGSQQVIQQEQSKTRIMNNHNQLVFT